MLAKKVMEVNMEMLGYLRLVVALVAAAASTQGAGTGQRCCQFWKFPPLHRRVYTFLSVLLSRQNKVATSRNVEVNGALPAVDGTLGDRRWVTTDRGNWPDPSNDH